MEQGMPREREAGRKEDEGVQDAGAQAADEEAAAEEAAAGAEDTPAEAPASAIGARPALAGHRILRWTLRYLVCALGIVINSFGIAFITEGALGTSPISSVPYVISLGFPISFGTVTFIMNMGFILIQIILLRRDFKAVQLLQILANALFSACIDLSTNLLWWLAPTFPPVQLLSVLLGCLILALGIAIEVAPNVVVVPGEGIVRAITRVSGLRFGTVKIAFDCTLVGIALLLSILFFHGIRGLGLGTIICALIVGWIVNQFDAHLPFIKRIRDLAW